LQSADLLHGLNADPGRSGGGSIASAASGSFAAASVGGGVMASESTPLSSAGSGITAAASGCIGSDPVVPAAIGSAIDGGASEPAFAPVPATGGAAAAGGTVAASTSGPGATIARWPDVPSSGGRARASKLHP
jgi:hypothetical protein